ncbi:hypothetical protein [Microbacterium sp.]|uniref:hypothetical protein n=1 Tax=Microbacterium sp. TaxID=51671 RepID=UPI0026090D7A|nr:hypothetical protein [Microbacterium sp.]
MGMNGDNLLPGLQSRKPSNLGPWVAGVLGGIVIIGGIIMMLTLGGDDEYNPDNASEAISQCEGEIEEKLKAPSTAEFDSTATGSGTWTVVGTVDAENSFGAKLRSSYQCTVVIDVEAGSARVTIDSFE